MGKLPTCPPKTSVTVYLAGCRPDHSKGGDCMTNPSAKYAMPPGHRHHQHHKKEKPQRRPAMAASAWQFRESYYSKYSGGLTLSHIRPQATYNIFFNNTYSYNKTRIRQTVTSDILNTLNNLLLTEEASNNYSSNTNKTDRPTLGIDLYHQGLRLPYRAREVLGWTTRLHRT